MNYWQLIAWLTHLLDFEAIELFGIRLERVGKKPYPAVRYGYVGLDSAILLDDWPIND